MTSDILKRAAEAQFRKKPVVISAIQWNGENLRDVVSFTDGPPDTGSRHAGMAWEAYEDLVSSDGLKIFTLEGAMSAAVGDWIIRGVKGEYYPCKPDIFAQTYERAEEGQPTLIPDMAAAIAERDAEIARLTARAEAAEAMADRLAVALKETSNAHMSWVHDSRDGCWTIEDFDSESAVATEALAAHAAMKEGTSTLSPITAAARVLLAAGPHGPLAPLYDAVRQYTGALPGSDEEGEIIDGMDEGLRALAEQEKADG